MSRAGSSSGWAFSGGGRPAEGEPLVKIEVFQAAAHPDPLALGLRRATAQTHVAAFDDHLRAVLAALQLGRDRVAERDRHAILLRARDAALDVQRHVFP